MVTVSLSANGVSIDPGAILRLPLSHTSYLPPDWFEWPPWNTPHLGFKRHKVIISTVPLLKRGKATEPGEAESESFTQGGTSIVRDITTCLLAQWPPDFLAFEFPVFITSSSKSVCNLFILSNAVVHYSASLQPCRYYWLFFYPFSLFTRFLGVFRFLSMVAL